MLIPKAFLISLVDHYKYTYWKFWPPNKTANPYNWRKFPSTTHFKDVTAACINKTLASDNLFISPNLFFFHFYFCVRWKSNCSGAWTYHVEMNTDTLTQHNSFWYQWKFSPSEKNQNYSLLNFSVGILDPRIRYSIFPRDMLAKATFEQGTSAET